MDNIFKDIYIYDKIYNVKYLGNIVNFHLHQIQHGKIVTDIQLRLLWKPKLAAIDTEAIRGLHMMTS